MSENYYTHRKYLRAALDKLDLSKPVTVMEFGTGDGSAVVFEEYTKKYPELKVISYEADASWHSAMSEKYSSSQYTFNHVQDWNTLLVPENFTETYEFIFVDQAPWEARTNTINLLKDKCKTIMLHDYDFYNDGFVSDTKSVEPGSFFHNEYGNDFELIPEIEFYPPTLVMINKNL
jgi:16S rRNA A1518/A1519 N6-dimethyltransferase RsmA/KsgA/DIM1 with predicted DNA glycosylase/AP lyase activity